ncbi:hypothetical protein R3F64_01370 [Halomonas sp. 5021]|uniref:DUF968 domain-containing protein n=1 Tax=Halomonas sp. 5021 TaxID=3082156 RepID=UPI002FCA3778
MKRTPLAHKSPLKNKAPMARKPIKRKATRKQSTDKRWRSEAYLVFVRSLPCCNCQGPGRDPHHVIGLHWGLSGQGLTAPDSFAMSLCRECHDTVHRSPELQQMQPQWLRTTLRAGLKQFTGEAGEQLLHALAFLEAQEQ